MGHPGLRLRRLLYVLLVSALFVAGCGQTSVEVSPVSWPRQTPIELRVGDLVNIKGFAPDAVEIKDSSLLALRPSTEKTSAGIPIVTYKATARGKTEIVVTQSMCLAITVNCSDAAFYYILPVQVQ